MLLLEELYQCQVCYVFLTFVVLFIAQKRSNYNHAQEQNLSTDLSILLIQIEVNNVLIELSVVTTEVLK